MSTEIAATQNEDKELLFNMNHIPEFFQTKCKLELKETPEIKIHCIQELKNMLTIDKTTKDICFHDDLLVQYLRHSKYDVNKAFDHLRNLNVIRKKEYKMFESIPDDYFRTKQSTKFISILPKRSSDGCTLVLFELGKWDPSELGLEDVKRIILMTFLQLLRDPMSQINGFKIIHDFAGTRFEHLKYCTPQNLYLFYYVSVHCIPGRYKEIHLINENPVLKLLWAVIKGFLSNKIKSRVFYHSNTNELLDYFPKSVLPVKYGGELLDVYGINFGQKANEEQKENTVEGQPNFF